jgi:hypothetical protein
MSGKPGKVITVIEEATPIPSASRKAVLIEQGGWTKPPTPEWMPPGGGTYVKQASRFLPFLESALGLGSAALYWVPRLLDPCYTKDNLKTDLAFGPVLSLLGLPGTIGTMLTTKKPLAELKNFAVKNGEEVGKFELTNFVFGPYGATANFVRWIFF